MVNLTCPSFFYDFARAWAQSHDPRKYRKQNVVTKFCVSRIFKIPRRQLEIYVEDASCFPNFDTLCFYYQELAAYFCSRGEFSAFRGLLFSPARHSRRMRDESRDIDRSLHRCQAFFIFCMRTFHECGMPWISVSHSLAKERGRERGIKWEYHWKIAICFETFYPRSTFQSV